MKAIINGTTVEGTPQEIVEYQVLMNNRMKVEQGPFKPVVFYPIHLTFADPNANMNFE